MRHKRVFIPLLAGMLFIGSLGIGHAAVDMFLLVPNVPGESTDAQHSEWIDVRSFTWGGNSPQSSPSGGGSRTSGRVTMNEFVVHKMLDRSSARLLQEMSKGNSFPTVVFEVVQASGGKVPIMKITFENVIVTSFDLSFDPSGAMPTETLGFQYTRYRVEYTRIDRKGQTITEAPLGWDLTTNTAH